MTENDTADAPETTVLHELLHLFGLFAAVWVVLLVGIATLQATNPPMVVASGLGVMVVPSGALSAMWAVAVRLSMHLVSGGHTYG